MNNDLLVFDEVGKNFSNAGGDFSAVTSIKLSVQAGEILTVVGPSGCGKSTLLNMAAGLFAPTSGTVRYRGKIVTGLNHATGYMTQKDHLLPWRSVIGNIEVPLEIKGLSKSARRERSQELIDFLGLSGFEDAHPSQLSGGMRKRTSLARLLAYDPETLLLDEPFAALDPQLRARMQGELLRMCRILNKTVIFVTHDIDEAVAIGDRCVIFSPRPGTIREVVDIPLPRERNPLRLRSDPAFTKITAQLWEMIVPDEQQPGKNDD